MIFRRRSIWCSLRWNKCGNAEKNFRELRERRWRNFETSVQ
jgi:hypothetical protein